MGTVLKTAKKVNVRKLGYEDTSILNLMKSLMKSQQKMVTIQYCPFVNCNSKDLAEGFFNLTKQSKIAKVLSKERLERMAGQMLDVRYSFCLREILNVLSMLTPQER